MRPRAGAGLGGSYAGAALPRAFASGYSPKSRAPKKARASLAGGSGSSLFLKQGSWVRAGLTQDHLVV